MWGPYWVIMRMQFKCKNCPSKSCQHGLRHCGVLTLCLKKKKQTKRKNKKCDWSSLLLFLLHIIIQQDDMSTHISHLQHFFVFNSVDTRYFSGSSASELLRKSKWSSSICMNQTTMLSTTATTHKPIRGKLLWCMVFWETITKRRIHLKQYEMHLCRCTVAVSLLRQQ